MEGGVKASVVGKRRDVSKTGFPSTGLHGMGKEFAVFPESVPTEGVCDHSPQGNSKYFSNFLVYETELDPGSSAKGTISMSLYSPRIILIVSE